MLWAETEEACSQASEDFLNFLAGCGYKASREKAQLCQQLVRYLGLIISEGTRVIDPERIKVKVKSLSRVWLFVTPWTVAYQAPLSMGFSRQEYWSGLPFPSPGDLPDPGIEPRSPALQADALTSEPTGSPRCDLKLWFLLCTLVFVLYIYLLNTGAKKVVTSCELLHSTWEVWNKYLWNEWTN